jgi:hypothetical protein
MAAFVDGQPTTPGEPEVSKVDLGPLIGKERGFRGTTSLSPTQPTGNLDTPLVPCLKSPQIGPIQQILAENNNGKVIEPGLSIKGSREDVY